jgi:hypothetical protein
MQIMKPLVLKVIDGYICSDNSLAADQSQGVFGEDVT